jgi:predicted ATP-dependent serine protease
MVCESCREEVNDGAGKCPSCGEYPGVRRAWHTLVWAAEAGNVEFSAGATS